MRCLLGLFDLLNCWLIVIVASFTLLVCCDLTLSLLVVCWCLIEIAY